MIDLKSLGIKLKKARVESKYTQQKVADFLELNREQVSYYENGVREIPILVLKNISILYGKNIEYFLGEKEEKIETSRKTTGMSKNNIEKIEWAKNFVLNLHQLEKINRRSYNV